MDSEIERQIQNLQTYVIISVATASMSAVLQIWNHVRRSKCTSGCCSVEIENEEETIQRAAVIQKRQTSKDDYTIINMSDNEKKPLIK
jgi:hypothetical protein